MIYADHYNIAADGTRSEAPVIDYQAGSLRDDFNFGSVLLFRTESLKEAASMMKADYQAAGFYDLRLKLTEKYSLEHINEYLYSEVELDTRKTGEKLFDYVDPKNRASQIEMEQAATEYLKEVGGYLKPGFKDVDITEGEFPVEMTVMIPVRNRIRTIRDAIDSALQQKTTFKYNVFVVENGPECHSTDGTTEAVDEYTDPRLIHVVTERRDLCVGGSWNLAAHDPRCGRFIVQLDSDDVYLDENTLQKFYDAFQEQKVAMLIGSYVLTDINKNILPPGKIDHAEWTPENGRNNALRINGDGDLSIEKENKNNTYKDRIRTWELQARIALNKNNEK